MENFEASDAGVFQPLRPVCGERRFERSYATLNFENQGEISWQAEPTPDRQLSANSFSLQSRADQSRLAKHKTVAESNHGTQDEHNEMAGSTEKYAEMIAKVEDMQKSLATVKETLTEASVRCHILNVDMVTMFNPEVVDTLNRMVEDCGACMDRMASQVRETES